MLMCHSFLRSRLDDYQFKDLAGSVDYIKILTLINDNLDGPNGALSIQNVARMSLVYDRYPGEWHGNKSISLVFQSLNRLYAPLENFEMCVFGDDTIFLDKIKKAGERMPRNWLKE